MTLYDTLTEYCSSDAYPFHMPGHKRRAAFGCDPARIDLTEIDGFDDLHNACGILQEAEMRAARLYHSEETHFLVNGSTAGILSAIAAVSRPGACLLMARNSHRSAFHGAALARVKTSYLHPAHLDIIEPPKYSASNGSDGPSDSPASNGSDGPSDSPASNGSDGPSDSPASNGSNGPSDSPVSYGLMQSYSSTASDGLNGPVDPAQVERALDSLENVCAVFITSPTYDGVVSDVARIAQIAHRRGIPLIVDEAHGAHFGMHEIFPKSSVRLGADLVIHSLHKTLPALTQTALIHVNGKLIDRGELRRQLDIFQTSSPSYVLMASIDQCISLLSSKGNELFDAYAKRLARFYRESDLRHLSLIHTDDPSRILIRPPVHQPLPLTAMNLYQSLRERFHLQPEMVTPSYVLMLSSVCDDDEGFARLTDALHTLDREYDGSELCTPESEDTGSKLRSPGPEYDGIRFVPCPGGAPECGETPEICCTIAQALDKRAEAVPFSASEGRIASEYLTLYPPGVPLLVPGERIPAGLIRRVIDLKQQGYTLTGLEDRSISMIRVVALS